MQQRPWRQRLHASLLNQTLSKAAASASQAAAAAAAAASLQLSDHLFLLKGQEEQYAIMY